MQKQQINVDKNVTISFTPQQLSIVISLLKRGVYDQVAPVITSIEAQIIEQLKPKQSGENGQPTSEDKHSVSEPKQDSSELTK